MQLMHNTVADETGDNGPVCDSWATSSAGVTCTANMPSLTASPLTIVTTSLPTGYVGTGYNDLSGGVYAAGGTPGYSYSITQGSLPNGLTFNSTSGIISGFPTSTGTSSFTVRATDAGGSPPASQALSITVDPELPFSVTSTSLPTATQNQYYQQVLGGTGGTWPYTWAVSAGALPTGLTLLSYGVIVGAPTVSGTFSFTVTATDSSSPANTATKTLTLNIPPTTSVLLPSSGATLQGSTWLDAGASSQNGIERVQFEISGGSVSDDVIGTGTGTLIGYLFDFNTATFPNGTYTLQSVATDKNGLATTGAPVTVTIENPPTTSVLVPSTGASLAGSRYVAATATNATSVQFLLFGGSYGFEAPVICPATLTLFGWLCDWNTTTVPNGSYVLVSEASGPTGNTYSSGVSISVKN
jgi:hypothetical protein